MKASKVLFAIFCLTLTACAKHHGVSPANNTSALAATVVTQTDIAQDDSDNGDDLTADFESSADDHVVIVNSNLAGPLGIVRLEGEAAKKLFDSLAVQETEYPASDEIQSNTARIGKNIECYQKISRASLEAKYDCNFYYNYETGEAKTLNSNVEVVRETSNEFTHTDNPMIYVTTINEKAKLINDSLVIEPFKDIVDHEVKTGKNISCVSSPGEIRYFCQIAINTSTGEALKAN